MASISGLTLEINYGFKFGEITDFALIMIEFKKAIKEKFRDTPKNLQKMSNP